jgi:ATP-dependent HslUV protease ATP-binding subunit HslU
LSKFEMTEENLMTEDEEKKKSKETADLLEVPAFSPREIVSELDRNIIGQSDAKRAVAVALRNRWRRQQLDPDLQEEVYPKNILMIGPTGVGKTEIARRLAKLAQAPFIKIEATKFTEVGYVGRDVESIIRDLVEISLHMTREKMRRTVRAQAEVYAEERVLDALVGESAGQNTRSSFREKLRKGELNDREIEVEVNDNSNPMPSFDIPGMPGASMSMVNIGDMFGKAFGSRTKTRRMTVGESYEVLMEEESDKLLDEEKTVTEAMRLVEQNGIVFVDELDKITARQDVRGGDVSREGVQRDLLPLIEGTTVSTKHGSIRTDHILFIASGAFHYAKPSDLLAELQGRLPIRVELRALTREDFKRILTETDACLVKQYKALIGTEGMTLDFDEEAIDELARLAYEVNEKVENIGARRLLTVMEKLLEEISFTASDRSGEEVTITEDYVREQVSELAESADLSRFIL